MHRNEELKQPSACRPAPDCRVNSRSLDTVLRAAIEADAGLTLRTMTEAHAAYKRARAVQGAQCVDLDRAWQTLVRERQPAVRDVVICNEHSERWWSARITELRVVLAALEGFKAAEAVPNSPRSRDLVSRAFPQLEPRIRRGEGEQHRQTEAEV